MRAEHTLDGHKKWWISGGAAVFTHLAVLLVLPDAPPGQTFHVHADLSEFELTTVASARADVAATQRSGGAASAAAGTRSAQRAARASTLHARTKPGRAATAPHAPAGAHMGQTASSGALFALERVATEPSGRSFDPVAVVNDPAAHAVNTNLPGSHEGEALASTQAEQALAGAVSLLGTPTADGVGAGRGAGVQGAATGHAGGRAPGLLAARNPCTGYFPATASANHGAVQLSVHVDAEGHTRAARILNELPAGQEFGRAARACAAALRFVPASDELGAPIEGDAKLELRFSRS